MIGLTATQRDAAQVLAELGPREVTPAGRAYLAPMAGGAA